LAPPLRRAIGYQRDMSSFFRRFRHAAIAVAAAALIRNMRYTSRHTAAHRNVSRGGHHITVVTDDTRHATLPLAFRC